MWINISLDLLCNFDPIQFGHHELNQNVADVFLSLNEFCEKFYRLLSVFNKNAFLHQADFLKACWKLSLLSDRIFSDYYSAKRVWNVITLERKRPEARTDRGVVLLGKTRGIRWKLVAGNATNRTAVCTSVSIIEVLALVWSNWRKSWRKRDVLFIGLQKLQTAFFNFDFTAFHSLVVVVFLHYDVQLQVNDGIRQRTAFTKVLVLEFIVCFLILRTAFIQLDPQCEAERVWRVVERLNAHLVAQSVSYPRTQPQWSFCRFLLRG